MRNDYVSHFCALLSRQSERNAAGVNRNTLVYEKTCQTLFWSRAALTIKGAW